MTKVRVFSVLLGIAALAACEKNGVLVLGGPTAGSNVKFHNFSVNDPQVNFFANDVKVTAISSASCTPAPTDSTAAATCLSTGIEAANPGVAYGALGNAGLYSSLAPGQYTIAAKVALGTDKGLSISNFSTALADGKWYSLFLGGVYDATGKSAAAFIVEDPIPATVDLTATYARFVVAISNIPATVSPKAMTLYAKNTTTGDSVLVGSNVAYANASAFVTMSGGLYDLTARYPGSNTAVATLTGQSFSAGRVYTVTARGDATSTATATKPTLSLNTNR